MKICGIVAEFNPFHNGHAYLLEQARQRLGGDCGLVCCMSGNFVQRGEAALLPKHLRAKAAVACGADLVLELPAAHSLRSAEGFASAAVGLLDSLGLVTDLFFGAETPDTAVLNRLAGLLLEHQTTQNTLIHLRTGVSYAAARERALYQQVQEQATILRSPNNILAVEYCKAIQSSGSTMAPHAIGRLGAAHDGAAPVKGIASASFLREALCAGNAVPEGLMPPGAMAVLQEALDAGLVLKDSSRLDGAAVPYLLRLSSAELSALPDAAEGLEHRLYSAIRSGRSLAGMAQAAQTRRYPLARVRRMLLCAYLEITQEEAAAAPRYLRVLAFNDRGREILRQGTSTARLPILTKPARARELGGDVCEAFSREALRADLYHLALPCSAPPAPGADWRSSPIYLPSNP